MTLRLERREFLALSAAGAASTLLGSSTESNAQEPPSLSVPEPISLHSAMPVYMPGSTRVHETALRELALAFGVPEPGQLDVHREDAAPAGTLFAGLLGESKTAQDLARLGRINLHNVPPTRDAYELVNHGGALFLLGNTPRGLLHAVYKAQELAREGTAIAGGKGIRGTFQIRERFFHHRFNGWIGEPADFRYISHLGASHCLLAHDWQGNHRHLQGYVTSPLFPDAVDAAEVAESHQGMKMMIEACLDHALEPCLWITELPCQGGPWTPEPTRQKFLSRFPEETLSDSGTYQGKVICFSHPKIQEFYRDLLARFFADFPEIGTFFLFGLDADGEFCDPESCPRCKGMSKFDQRDRLIRFLIEEGQKVRPGLRVLTTGWGWSSNTEEFLARQKALPSSSGLFLAAETDGWQAERQSHELLWKARALCREKGQTFIGYDDLHWGDDTVHDINDIQDYPLGVGAKIRRWHELEVDGVFDHWGGFNHDVSSNSIACREFFLNPLADPEAVCRGIAERQFGRDAGAHVFEAWKALEQAHAVLSMACSWAPSQWPGWYGGREYAPTAEEFAKRGLQGGEPPRQATGFTYNDPGLANRLQSVADAWQLAYPHYIEASERMEQAIDKAMNEPLFYAFWWTGETKSPTRREHIRRQRLYIESMAFVGREIGAHFALNALFERVGRDAVAYKQQAHGLLLEDAKACRNAAAFFEKLKINGDDRRSDRDWAVLYHAKAEAIDAYAK
ncbi:MAG: hypothetical protein WC655_07835 [Candidatus Hydrogenedentales bacterium]|jgi:hypothetical protein